MGKTQHGELTQPGIHALVPGSADYHEKIQLNNVISLQTQHLSGMNGGAPPLTWQSFRVKKLHCLSSKSYLWSNSDRALTDQLLF